MKDPSMGNTNFIELLNFSILWTITFHIIMQYNAIGERNNAPKIEKREKKKRKQMTVQIL